MLYIIYLIKSFFMKTPAYLNTKWLIMCSRQHILNTIFQIAFLIHPLSFNIYVWLHIHFKVNSCWTPMTGLKHWFFRSWQTRTREGDRHPNQTGTATWSSVLIGQSNPFLPLYWSRYFTSVHFFWHWLLMLCVLLLFVYVCAQNC